ncbi:MAG: polyphosphate polymerase domain-containing protein [Proteobacteria bacterium]|nr:polyphosphate polymerase domain-containing protein [Pseudomonadota bacterium]
MKNSEIINFQPIERYELKFIISFSLIDPISEYVSIYASPDKYSLKTRSGYYKVNNLYLDSPEYLFLKMRLNGSKNRFNMRVRAYGDHAELPYFLEIKQKTGNIVKKYRTEVSDPLWYKTYTNPGSMNIENRNCKNRQLFERLLYSYNASPKIFTQYMRKAWISEVDSYARITFDLDLRYMAQSNYCFNYSEHELSSCDTETMFDPGCSVILELKCFSAYVPLWMIDMIKTFNLNRRSFSKYLTGAVELFSRHRYDRANIVSIFN